MNAYLICNRCVVLCVASFSLIAASASAQPPAAAVSAGHEALKHEVGTWDADVKTWLAPDSEPVVSKGVEKNRMLGPYWVVGVFESDLGGFQFRGQSQVGYDPATKKFIGTWIDSTSPTLNRLEGTMEGKELTMKAQGVDPQTGRAKTTKMVTTYPDENHKTFEAYEPVPGKEGQWWKTMEAKYTRRQKSNDPS